MNALLSIALVLVATPAEPATTFQAGKFTPLFQTLQKQVQGDRHTFTRQGRPIATNPSWVRDHIHEMKAYKFWEPDLTSFVDTLLNLQHPDGFFYEIIGDASHDHQTFVSPKFVRIEPENDLAFIRLEMEADIEYLMVEAAYTIWQATGDADALKKRLPRLERALEYDFSDPTRWDSKHGALKRTFSIDTWDFTYGISDHNRRIDPGLPMGIMHGDNSGLYQACRQLATLLRAAGETEKAPAWDSRAEQLRQRINDLCFNGKYYTHQILLQPVDTGVDEKDILSLSNPYDISRGLPTHEMAVSIIDEYQARRTKNTATHFAEWYSIDPPYPKFGPYTAGKYINGGICGFVAGELAKAAFNHGREAYAVDILNRVADMVEKDGALFFLYDVQGKDMGGGPRGWAAAAVISALIEGLAGITDNSALYHDTTFAPRFAAAGIDQATVCARYAPSGEYAALEFNHDPATKTITLRIAGPKRAQLRILLPPGAHAASIASPSGLDSKIESIEASHYLTTNPVPIPSNSPLDVLVQYK
ncbi:MAG TPA: hypothetical protein VMZ06_06380 [Candidatus Bathyarchaeia archaeon]|nr:hypothetical protein [Candidatus Bathyarchaeia archaeon]